VNNQLGCRPLHKRAYINNEREPVFRLMDIYKTVCDSLETELPFGLGFLDSLNTLSEESMESLDMEVDENTRPVGNAEEGTLLTKRNEHPSNQGGNSESSKKEHACPSCGHVPKRSKKTCDENCHEYILKTTFPLSFNINSVSFACYIVRSSAIDIVSSFLNCIVMNTARKITLQSVEFINRRVIIVIRDTELVRLCLTGEKPGNLCVLEVNSSSETIVFNIWKRKNKQGSTHISVLVGCKEICSVPLIVRKTQPDHGQFGTGGVCLSDNMVRELVLARHKQIGVPMNQ
jgi:hypothetical protein